MVDLITQRGGALSLGLYSGTEGERFNVDLDKLRSFSERWAYVVRKRRRWRSFPSAIVHLRQIAQQDLETTLGIKGGFLQRIAKGGGIEVDFGSSVEVLDAAATAPWEMILNFATDQYRTGSMLLVSRFVGDESDNPTRTGTPANDFPNRSFVITSAPGLFSRYFSFDVERQLLEESFSRTRLYHLDNPGVMQLRERQKDFSDALLHLSGVDSVEGAQVISNDMATAKFPPFFDKCGFYLAGEDDKESEVGPQALAEAIVDRSAPPLLVSFNCYNSGSFLASYAVRQGCLYAIGVQDELDNPLLEKFFAKMYREWNSSDANDSKEHSKFGLLGAFWQAVLSLYGQVNYGYLVLWSRISHRYQFAELQKYCRDTHRGGRPAREGNVTVTSPWQPEDLEVDIRPFRELNYSMLHNHRSMFQRFVLKSRRPMLQGVQVEVALQIRGETYHYRTTCDVKDYFQKLDRIQVSLTSELLRTLRESVYTTLYIRVTFENHVVAELTEKIRLLPINEWRDSKRDGVWLPSFVLPYDQAVLKVVGRAQNYLKALLDNNSAGFNGYQAITRTEGIPDYSGVHAQLRAIWSTLIYDFSFDYIAPPPTFTEQNQRLRTPSDVFEERRGTCIDLALFLASCLEHIEIRPVLFLLSGHVFPGYFRSPEDHTEFVKLFSSEKLDPNALSWRMAAQPQPWVLEVDAYHQILDFVRRSCLVPLESVWLTRRAGVSDAHAQGRRNLSNRARFEAIYDIRQARINGVTPLPIGGTEP